MKMVRWGQVILSSLVVLVTAGMTAVVQANDRESCAEAVAVSDEVLATEPFGDGLVVFRSSSDQATEIEVVHYRESGGCRPLTVDSYGIEGGEPQLEEVFAHTHDSKPLLLAIVSWPHNHRGLGMTGRFYSVYVYHQEGRHGHGHHDGSGLQLHTALTRRQGMSGVVGTVEGGEYSSFAGTTRLGATALLASLTPPGEPEAEWRRLCNRDGTQMEITACAVVALAEAQRALNSMLVHISEGYAEVPQVLAELEQAQSGWHVQMKADLTHLFPLGPDEDPRVMYGSSYPMAHALAHAHLVRQRTEYLREFWLPMDARRD